MGAAGNHKSSCYCTVNGGKKSETMIRDYYYYGGYCAAASHRRFCHSKYKTR
jgi:hypothetical protein